jgi:hypothetical protein
MTRRGYEPAGQVLVVAQLFQVLYQSQANRLEDIRRFVLAQPVSPGDTVEKTRVAPHEIVPRAAISGQAAQHQTMVGTGHGTSLKVYSQSSCFALADVHEATR